jgi:hypothetical protein
VVFDRYYIDKLRYVALRARTFRHAHNGRLWIAIGSLANIAYTHEVQLAIQMDQGIDDFKSIHKLYQLAFHGSVAALWLIDAWSWLFFAINTSLTASIMYKIMSVAYLSLPFLYLRICC